MVAVVSPERMPRRAHGRSTHSYGGQVEPAFATVSRPVGPPVRLPASTYRRRRAVAAGLAVLAVLALAAVLGVLGGGPLPVPEQPAQLRSADRGARAVYVVQPGDTFWSIARQLDPKGDPRPLVDRLVAAHGGPTLHVGERLPLPVP